MKKQTYTMIALLVLVGSMAVAAQAQTSGRTQMRVDIPFQFHVGNKSLPAGQYEVHQLNTVSGPAMLQLRSKDDRSVATIQMQEIAGKAKENATLIFNRYGNQYFFAQYWIDGDSTGLQAPKSKSERATLRELTALGIKTETIALSSRR